MEKWCVLDERKDSTFLDEYASREQAELEAEREWKHLTKHDKNQRTFFGVVLAEVYEVDEEFYFNVLENGTIYKNAEGGVAACQ